MANLLKQLELNGFKSFAARTVFDFSHGITAIVGPNGSGKSNVIDAVRWLLGEREAKNLRGAKSEDLIFAGTAKRPRMGQGSASLYFENRDGFFPVDMAEVVVTRQVNRDGTNQYFLNKSEIRLKDLVDFFAQARLGTKGLIVVSQGNSDVFIQSAPSVRREMIEEMLGLREYQIKRTEAERRLRNTQINLDKVKALTEEILPHLRSLKRQTNRWERRDALATELTTLENEFFGREWLEFSTKAAKIAGEISSRAGHLDELKPVRTAADAHLRSVESAQPEERKEIEAIKHETGKLLERRSALQKEIGRVEARLEIASRPKSAGTIPGALDADALHDLLRRIRTKLSLPGDLAVIVREVLSEIDRVLAPSAIPAAAAPVAVPPELHAEFAHINADLTALEAEITALKEKEQALEKNQEQFYQTFKAAVAAHEKAKDDIERWEAGTQQLAFEVERIKLREDEWARGVASAGRRPEEFKQFSSGLEVFDRGEAERRIFRLRGELAAIGEIDEALLKEARETETRYEFLQKESTDLEAAKNDLRKLIADLNQKISTEFGSALVKINEEFDKFFGLMFGGGNARLKLERPKPKVVAPVEEGEAPAPKVEDAVEIEEEEESENDEGLEIDIKMARKRITSLDMLSGGERSLVGIAALFALISVSPPPFLVLDEVDAALDERNARRFSEMLKDFSKKTQFILVTHNRATMEAADLLYGITLADDGTSKAVSLKLDPEKGVADRA